MMKTKQAKTILKRFDYKLLTKTNICVGTAVIKRNNKWKLQIYLRDQLDSHKHLLNLRFGDTARLIKKDEKKPSENELEPELIVVKKFMPFEHTGKYRPCPGGVSIGHYQITAGTFGVVVYRPKEPPETGYDRFILSNNHVLANSNQAEIGDPITQPGPCDGPNWTEDCWYVFDEHCWTPEDIIGTLEDFVEILFDNYEGPYNHVDAAICKPTNESDILDSIMDQPGLTDIVKEAEEGEYVIKVGRTTERTEGYIYGFSGLIAVNYGIGIAVFDDQIITGYIGAPGDSGSFLMSKCGKRALGLLFAGSEYYQMIIYNRATKVEELLDVTFAPVKRLPTVLGKIVGKLVSTVRKICLHCCCFPPTEPPPPPTPEECFPPPDGGCYSTHEEGCVPCTIEYCTTHPPGVPEGALCPPLVSGCNSSEWYGPPWPPEWTELCFWEVVDVYCIEPCYCFCVYGYDRDTCPREMPPYDGIKRLPNPA
jgi:hypothetical protein